MSKIKEKALTLGRYRVLLQLALFLLILVGSSIYASLYCKLLEVWLHHSTNLLQENGLKLVYLSFQNTFSI